MKSKGDSRHGVSVSSTQEQLLYHRRRLTEPHSHRERVVEVLLPAAHPSEIQCRVRSDLIGAAARIRANHERHAWNYIKTIEGLAGSVPAGPHLVQLFWRKLGSVEDC
jgi:hypothetical protein